MVKTLTLCDYFLSIGQILMELWSASDQTQPLNFISPSPALASFLEHCKQHPYIQKESFEDFEIFYISYHWYLYIEEADQSFNILYTLKLFFNQSEKFRQLSKIVRLMHKNIFILNKELRRVTRKNKQFCEINVNDLINETMCFHPKFINSLINDDMKEDDFKGYESNQEFIRDWFAYVGSLNEIVPNGLAFSTDFDVDHAKMVKIDTLKETIEKRTALTKSEIPLIEIAKKYQLAHNEMILFMHTLKENIQFRNPMIEELMKLISSDYTEVYKNRTYLSESSNLIKNDLLQTIASDSPFANLNQKEYVINQALMQEVFSVPEDIRMPQTANSIKENVFFDVIEPRFRIHNLVLQKDLKQTLSVAINQFSSKVENVLQKWGVVARHPANNSSNQLLMLFHGAPGTGKTFAAEAIAGQLRKKIISTDISKISSRWVGQSEANIKELFNTYDYIYEQTDNPPILLFNEADQLLTKRIENPDHHTDIMHNSMQNLFLEAFESFSGILIATTNLKTNLDPAFDRRFHLKIEFPKPDYEERIELWKFHLGSRIPGVDKIPIELLAQTYHLTGGQINVIIHNACVEAASRPKREQKLMLKDLIKYCDLETNKAVKSKKIAGF